MTTIRDAINEYLTLRRALGFKLAKHDRLLNDFVDDLEHAGASTITIAAAVAWATKPAAAPPHARQLGMRDQASVDGASRNHPCISQ